MSKSLEEIAQKLHDADKKVQLIYAFNGNGKTRLSRALKELVAPKPDGDEDAEPTRQKILYYNAHTEDLFYWDNDLLNDAEPRLVIQPNSFTDWILLEQGQEPNITRNFQRYANDKLTPTFNEEYQRIGPDGSEATVKAFSEVTFSMETGDEGTGNLKISKGEESNFIWSIFYTLLEVVIDVLSVPEPGDRDSDQFNNLSYVFIDDPVTSLDENHLIQLAVDLAALIKRAPEPLKFVITTHSPLFYNVLHNELGSKACYLLGRLDDGTFELVEKQGDSNQSFSYHLHLKKLLEQAIASNAIERFHFTLLRNLYEKTASFLGYPRWSELLPDDKQSYFNRIIQFTSHSTLSSEAISEPSPEEKQVVAFLLNHIKENYSYWQQVEQNG
ncbi:hypothetical protein [Sphingomonas jaspsi]|uniref:hypothetical protein n=1 Tax=Sphingomonas jaspsi TaxID=392409 RepID=UPI0004B7F7DA|nr:hypothetical protein [Sphingomonas jaspsi]